MLIVSRGQNSKWRPRSTKLVFRVLLGISLWFCVVVFLQEKPGEKSERWLARALLHLALMNLGYNPWAAPEDLRSGFLWC